MFPSVHLHLITTHKKQNGKYPVKLRIIYDRKAKDFPIGLDLTPAEFESATAKSPRKAFQTISKKLLSEISKANKIIDEMGVFTFEKFRNQFYGRLRDASDIYSFFDSYIDQLKSEGRIKTADSYITAKSSFERFKKKLGLYDITPEFLREYHRFQKTRIDNDLKKHELSDTSIGIYVRSLRSVYNYAISLGVIKRDENYPFGKGKYVIPAGRNIKKALSVEQVSAIYNCATIPGTGKDKAKDFWMFSFLCNGVNFKDIALLRNKNVDGEMLRFVREKTKNTTRGFQVQISCFLNAPAKAIIEKWRNNERKPDNFLFPILKATDTPVDQTRKIAQFIQTTNNYMKQISEEIGLTKPATTYYSRHSAATILKRSGASIAQIQEALGHQSSTTTQRYLDSFDDESKKELSKSLTKFL